MLVFLITVSTLFTCSAYRSALAK